MDFKVNLVKLRVFNGINEDFKDLNESLKVEMKFQT